MKTRELSMKEKKVIWMLKEKRNSIRTIAKLGKAKSTVWNVLKKKETWFLQQSATTRLAKENNSS